MKPLPLPQIPEPCPKSWDDMHGDGQKRFCDHCQKHVHNLENYPADEAATLLTCGTSVCIQIRPTPTGHLTTLPHSSQKLKTKAVQATRRLHHLAAALAALLLLPKLTGCNRDPLTPPATSGKAATSQTAAPSTLLGDMAPPPQTLRGEVSLQPDTKLGSPAPNTTTTP